MLEIDQERTLLGLVAWHLEKNESERALLGSNNGSDFGSNIEHL